MVKNYKYNGKELQETGMYDYGARFYMPDLGRWGVIALMSSGVILAKGFSRDTGVVQVRGTSKKVYFNGSGQATIQWY